MQQYSRPSDAASIEYGFAMSALSKEGKQNFLKYHIVPNKTLLSTDFGISTSIETALAGKTISYSIQGSDYIVEDIVENEVKLTKWDKIISKGGVIHEIGNILDNEELLEEFKKKKKKK